MCMMWVGDEISIDIITWMSWHLIASQHFGSFLSLYLLGIHGICCVASGKPRRMSETTTRGSAGTRRVPSETTIFLAFQSPRSWGNSVWFGHVLRCTAEKKYWQWLSNDYCAPNMFFTLRLGLWRWWFFLRLFNCASSGRCLALMS